MSFGSGSAERLAVLDRNAAPRFIKVGCFKDGVERDLAQWTRQARESLPTCLAKLLS